MNFHEVPMHIHLREDGDATILALEGHLTIGEAEAALNETVNRLVCNGKSRLVLDLEQVTLMDSAGLGALVRAFNVTHESGGEAKLVNPDRHLQRLLEMSGMTHVFNIYNDAALAVTSFEGRQPRMR